MKDKMLLEFVLGKETLGGTIKDNVSKCKIY